MVLEVTARTDKGTIVPVGKKEYWELGMDTDGYHRVGAWQIKEFIDLTLPPRGTTKERFVAELPADTTSADIEVKVTYFPSPKTELLVHQATKKLTFR